MVGSLKLKEILDTELPNTSPRSDTSEPPPPPEDDWLVSIEENLERARHYDAAGSGSKINICRVPRRLRDPLRREAYIPQVVSLGPYHHGNKLLKPMELHKWRALNNFLRRNNQRIELYLDSMKELEDRARACYEGPLKLMSSNEFAEMMLLDGCFVLELLQAKKSNGFEELGYAWNDPVFSMQAGVIQDSIERDMKLFENQIPLFVLDKLYGLQLKKPDLKGQVAQLAIDFFKPLIPANRPSTKIDIPELKSSTGDSTTFDPLSLSRLHCLDVFRKSFLHEGPYLVPRKRSRDNHEVDPRRQQPIHCATDLKDAGIKFRKHETDRLWDIQFNNGVLKIPPIMIEDNSESLLLNLIAFEQHHLDCEQHITFYVAFLGDLINSAEDVSYLRRHRIIEHWLGSDREVADLINSLGQEVVFDYSRETDSYYQLYKDINKHYDRKLSICNRKWNIWRAILKQTYFNNPWSILSLVAAVFLLLMTAAQTFYTVYPYYLPRK